MRTVLWLSLALAPGVDERIVSQEPAEAVAVALADMSRDKTDPMYVPQDERMYMRYVHIRKGGNEDWKVHSYVVNTCCSRTANWVTPVVLDGGRLVRWNLRMLASRHRPEDLAELIKAWDKLATGEQRFHVTSLVRVDPYVWENGKTYDGKYVAAPGGHALPTQQTMLNGICQSNASIIDWERATLYQMVSTADLGLGDPLYYEFADIPQKEQDLFKEQGIDLDFVRREGSDQFIPVKKSGVTGKPRRIEMYHGSRGRGTQGLLVVTRDPFDEDIKADQDAILTLLDLKFRATEIIFERRNGLPGFALYDANGNRQNEVPGNVARDNKINPPHTDRLQGAISCLRCHGDEDIWRPAENYVQWLLTQDIDVLGEQYKANVDRLGELYTGDTKTPFARGRDDHNKAAMIVTDGMTSKEACSKLAEKHNRYVYDDIYATQALDELGELPPEGKDDKERLDKAKAMFDELIPLPTPDANGKAKEDIRISELRKGSFLNRKNFNAVYPDLMFRKIEARSRRLEKAATEAAEKQQAN